MGMMLKYMMLELTIVWFVGCVVWAYILEEGAPSASHLLVVSALMSMISLAFLLSLVRLIRYW